jgi:hypothetical protein
LRPCNFGRTDLLKISSDSLHGDIYLVPNVIELDEIVIFPNNVEYLLSKAINNLFVNLQKKGAKTYYLTHIERNTTRGDEREIYALFEAIADKINIKKIFYNWNLNLIRIDRTKNSDELYFNHVGVQFFPVPLRFSPVEKDTAIIREFYEDSNDRLIIKTYPRYPDKKNYKYFLYTINKQDTVLTEFIAQSYSNADELTTRKLIRSKYNISNHFYKFNFVKDTFGLYYLGDLQHLSKRKIMSDTSYEVTSKVLLHSVENVSDGDMDTSKKRVGSYDGNLYKSKLPDSPGFWKKYVKH